MSVGEPSLNFCDPIPGASVNTAAVDSGLKRSLTEPADRFLARTGKQIRAAMVNASFHAAGGKGLAASKIADAIELLHAGSLIVDDIEDESVSRRGQPTLHCEIGVPLALNLGNWMYFQALERLSETQLPTRVTRSILARTLKTIRRCHEGQALDLGSRVDDLTVSHLYPIALEISRLKTGGLTALSAWLGAMAAGGNRLTRNALSRFGMSVGICLQMINDLQELRRFVEGAERYDDLRNARVTWAWAWAAKVSNRKQMHGLQSRLTQAAGDLHQNQAIARELLEFVGDRGDVFVNQRLQRELTILGEHVESTGGLRMAIERLQGKG